MAVVQISKIIVRHETYVTLPGIPTTPGDPSTLTPGLDVGELGYATDTAQVFIGADPSFATATRASFPYQNIEVLTEFSPLVTSLIARPPVRLANVPVNTAMATGIIIPTGFGGNAGNGVSIFYNLIETGSRTTRHGELKIATDGTQAGTPTPIDTFLATSPLNVSFSAVVSGANLSLMITNHEMTPLSFDFMFRIL